MRSGEFDKAWAVSDAVLRSHAGQPCEHWPWHLQYVWDGTPLNGKRVLVRCYHGLGDTIQFIRYAPLIKAVAREVIVWAQQPLIPLLKSVDGIDHLLPLHDGTPEVDYDVDVEIMELPHVFRTTLATIPLKIPYLRVAPRPLLTDSGKLAVGIFWQSSNWDQERRSIPFHLLIPLAEVPGIQLYIFQYDAEAAGWQPGLGIHPGEFSLYEYAQIICGLDLLVCIDAMPVHLAGAMDVPVWTLLHAEADWRWMDHRDDSPWYPSVRLFRQEVPGEWEPVIGRVKTGLLKLSAGITTASVRGNE